MKKGPTSGLAQARICETQRLPPYRHPPSFEAKFLRIDGLPKVVL